MSMEICVDQNVGFAELNRRVRNAAERDIVLKGCIGQRYIGTGNTEKNITVYGTSGNALGAYLNGGVITVCGNAQDAVGDTMNGGMILIGGNAGDATGYAMRGGRIYIRGNTGYRAGIHMKEYKDCRPVIVIGGRAGSFLGEYQAGGIIVALGMNDDGLPVINNFCGTGMHGGKIYLRCAQLPRRLPPQVTAKKISGGDDEQLCAVVRDYCKYFCDLNSNDILESDFFIITPNDDNPYKRMYVGN